MNRLASLAAVTLLLAACILCAVVAPVGAQSQCPIGGSITLPPTFSVNVRSGPGAEYSRVGGINSDSPPETVLAIVKDTQGTDWYRIGDGRWVIGRYWTIVCNATPTRTATRTATVGASATASPTRQPSSTTGPTPTATATPSEPEVIVYEYADGYIVVEGFCPRACLWSIRMENAPEDRR